MYSLSSYYILAKVKIISIPAYYTDSSCFRITYELIVEEYLNDNPIRQLKPSLIAVSFFIFKFVLITTGISFTTQIWLNADDQFNLTTEDYITT